MEHEETDLQHSEDLEEEEQSNILYDSGYSKTARKAANRMPRLRFSQEASEKLFVIYNSGVSKPNKGLREELAKELDKTPRSIQIVRVFF